MGLLIVAAIIGLFIFIDSHHYFFTPDISRTSHRVFGLLIACLGLWITSVIWLSIANLLVLIITSPFLIWPSLRPAAIRAWTVGVLALLCARFILFYAAFPVSPNRPMEPIRTAHFHSRYHG